MASMSEVWPIENMRGQWRLRLGDEIVFLENKTVPGGPTTAVARLLERRRPNAAGLTTHIKVLRADAHGEMPIHLIAVRNIVDVKHLRPD